MNWFILALCVTTVRSFREENNYDPEDRLFGGDMMLTAEQRYRIMNGGDIFETNLGYAAMSNVSVLWLPNHKTVPYNIVPELEKNPAATFGIMSAFREWEERSCLKFLRRRTEDDFIEFFKEEGCWSYVGRQGGAQNISLGEGCYDPGTVVHEIGHAMGFGHEQNRPDRDKYIQVRWENVPQKKRHNFEKYTNSKVDSLNSPYDYKSFMQYSKTAFGINDSVTLDPKQPDIFQLGQRLGFTDHDQHQAMQLYRCNGKTTRIAEVPKTYIPKGDHVCDFENGLCSYTQDNTDNFDWSRAYANTPSSETGPDTDHTTGRMGTYIFIEASSPRKKGDIARLLSKVFYKESNDNCLRFFLHMYSHNQTMMGDFNVYIKEGSSLKNVFHRSGSQKNDWTEVNVNFNPSGSYQVVFEGVRGTGYQGDISLDDISINHAACQKTHSSHKNIVHGPCEDVNDREKQYCNQWKRAGYCNTHKKQMVKWCRKTCNAC